MAASAYGPQQPWCDEHVKSLRTSFGLERHTLDDHRESDRLLPPVSDQQCQRRRQFGEYRLAHPQGLHGYGRGTGS